MEQVNQAPLSWLQQVASALQWPVIAVAAFWLGRAMSRLESRVLKAEKNVADLIERHLPHVHNALAEIRGLLMGERR